MFLIKELNFTENSTELSTFTHRILSNNTANCYVNTERGISIYDENWNFIKRITLKNIYDQLIFGNMFIYEEFIYIANSIDVSKNEFSLLKLDFDLNIINYHYRRDVIEFLMAFDSCDKRIFLLWKLIEGHYQIDVYSWYLRKLYELNTTSIKSYGGVAVALGLFANQLYIGCRGYDFDDLSGYFFILLTDINGQFIKTFRLIQNSQLSYIMNSISFDRFGSILFTLADKLTCLFVISLNVTTCNSCNTCMEVENSFLFSAKVDQSGRLVTIDPSRQKIQIYGS